METGPVNGTTLAPYGNSSVIAFVNEKGGVAKTTSCVNLAAALAQRNHCFRHHRGAGDLP
jgi:Mrp family chromosome partitioning ATPase